MSKYSLLFIVLSANKNGSITFVLVSVHQTLRPVAYLSYRFRVFENRMLRRTFEPKREEVVGSWRRLHNEELHNLYASPDIIRVIKSTRMKRAGHIARTGHTRNA
jgi:hypothetical protein